MAIGLSVMWLLIVVWVVPLVAVTVPWVPVTVVVQPPPTVIPIGADVLPECVVSPL